MGSKSRNKSVHDLDGSFIGRRELTDVEREQKKLRREGSGINKAWDEAISKWDRAKYAMFCAKLEVLLLHGRIDAAVIALRAFDGTVNSRIPSEGDFLDGYLPERVVFALSREGIHTVGAAIRASEARLKAIANVGDKTVDMIRRLAVSFKNGTPAMMLGLTSSEELEPLFDIDWEYLSTFYPPEDEEKESTQPDYD